MRANLVLEFDGAIAAGAQSFGLGRNHGELDAPAPKPRLPGVYEYLREKAGTHVPRSRVSDTRASVN